MDARAERATVNAAPPGEQEFTASGVGCRRCPALAACRRTIVDGVGSAQPWLMVVAEAPGKDEDASGIPFVGQSGQLLRATIAGTGLRNEHIYCTNVVRCRPPENRDPTPDEIENCLPWLVQEFELREPRVTLLLGRFARIYGMQAWGAAGSPGIVFVAEHPASLLRSGKPRDAWQETVREAARAAAGIMSRQHTVNAVTPEPFTFGHPAVQSAWLAVDTETDDLEEGHGKKLVTYQISDGHRAMLFRPEVDGFAPLAAGYHWYMHNAKYDLPLLGIPAGEPERWDDTALMAYVLRYPRVRLKEIGPTLTGVPMDPISRVLKYIKEERRVLKSKCRACKGWGQSCADEGCYDGDHRCSECEGEGHPVRYKSKWAKRSFSEALRDDPELATDYAIRDAVVTSRLARILLAELDRPEHARLRRYYHEIEKPALPVVLAMEQHGVTVDPDALGPLAETLQREIGQLTDALHQQLPGDFNHRSPQQLAGALLAAGFPLTEQTGTGDWQLDKAVLLKLAGVDAVADVERGSVPWTILEIRRMEKLYGTYVTKLLVSRDASGRVHTSFNQMTTNTNRLSSNNPNLQNIPIRGTIRKAIRRAFVAPPGRVLVKGDFSQLEVRIYAHYTQHPVLLAAYPWDGPARDVHQGTADTLAIARSDAKNVLFAAIYGAEGPKLAQTAQVPPERAGEFLSNMRANLDCLHRWPRHIAAQLTKQGFVETWLGWRGYFPLYWSPLRGEQKSALREAANLPIQGTASGIVKRFMARAQFYADEYSALPLLQVHDEMVYECDRRDAKAFAHMLAYVGGQVGRELGITVPLELNVEIGPNWGDTTPWQEWAG